MEVIKKDLALLAEFVFESTIEEVKAELEVYEDMNKQLLFDIDDKQGEKDLRSHVAKLRKVNASIERKRVAEKASYLAAGKKVDSDSKEISIITKRMIEFSYQPIKYREDEEAAYLEKDRLETEQLEQERLDAILKQEADLLAKAAELKIKEDAIKAAEAKIEQDRLIKEAAEKAAADATAKTEQDKIDALKKAEKEKEIAINAEKQRAAKEQADKIAAEKVLAEKDRKRIENVQHRARVEAGIEQQIFTGMAGALTKEGANKLMKAIRDGRILNVTINY